MKKYSKKINVFVLVTIFLLTSIGNAFALDDNKADIETAKKVAFSHIVSDMKWQGDKGWKKGIKVSQTTTMYDLEENASAYLLELVDDEENPSGYIVVGADKRTVPVIEFSYEGTSFITENIKKAKEDHEAKIKDKKIKHTKVYYLGQLTYLSELQDEDNSSEIYDISQPGNISKIDKSNLKKLKSNDKDESFKKDWDHLIYLGSSNPPTSASQFPITNPSIFESGYNYMMSNAVPNYDRYYKNMSDFATNAQNCSPTAGVNLLLYWYGMDSTKYARLYDNNFWNSAYNELHTLMYTNDSTGTQLTDIAPAMQTYFRNKGFNYCTATRISSVTNTIIKNEISIGRPFLYCLLENITANPYYGSHTVFGVGYNDYIYNNSETLYVRIHDGGPRNSTNHYANRFVWAASGYTNLIKIIPG